MLNRSGIGFLEIIMSVTILSIGVLIVFRPLLSSLDVFRDMDLRLETNRLSGNYLWQLEDEAARNKAFLKLKDHGVFVGAGKAFPYRMSAHALDEEEQLFMVDLSVERPHHGPAKTLSRQAYVLLPYEIPAA